MDSKQYYQYKNIYMIPSVHGTMEFANIVRNVFFEIEPDCIALELPEQMTGNILKGIRRLPYLSAITFPDDDNTYHYIPIQPCDSIIEGARLADEFGKSIYFVDKDVHGLIPPQINSPDTYYVTKIGLKNYLTNYLAYLDPSPKESIHYLRELYMAHRVRILSLSFNKVLFVYGLYHHKRLIEFFKREADLSEEVNRLVDRFELKKPYIFAQRDEPELRHLPVESYIEMLGTIPFEMYLYEVGRKGISSYQMQIELPPEEMKFKEHRMQIKKFKEKAKEGAEKIRNMETYPGKADSYDYLHEIIFQARRLYNREWDDLAPMGKLSLVLKFARNYALVSHQLVPSPFQLITSAKNIVNDDFAWELARLINFYPFFENEDNLDEILSMNKKALIDDEEYNLEPHLPMKPWLLESIPLKKRPKEKKPGEWEKVWKKGMGLVSYPPEDIVIENYFNYLRRKAKKILEEGYTRSVEFKGSVMDGIDIKETIRNLHLDKIFVKEQIPVKGDIGTVVVIFDERDDYIKYPFQITWYAEHEQESDLAFYSTAYNEKLIGPGISKAEYGGLLSVFPPRGIFEVWSDPRFNKAQNRHERLLMAGIMYADKKYILYVAPKPPRNYFYSLAERLGHHIMFIPLTDLSQNMVKRIRTFHMLADRRLRTIANRYIRMD
jgi:hypothetical protein